MKAAFILVSLVIVAGALSLATIHYHNHKLTVASAANSAVITANNTLKEHDAVNAAALTAANTQVATLNSQKVTLCTQIKTAKLSQPLCP